jgi:hypothetical protein
MEVEISSALVLDGETGRLILGIFCEGDMPLKLTCGGLVVV